MTAQSIVGSGVAFATDKDGAGLAYPYNKLAFGLDGMQTIAADADGQRLPVMSVDRSLTALGYQQITLAGSTALTVPGGATSCVIFVEAVGVRYRDDGVAPTTAVGMPLNANGNLVLNNQPALMAAIRFIQQTSGAILNVSYYK